jgi:GTPase SAR1 family protein
MLCLNELLRVKSWGLQLFSLLTAYYRGAMGILLVYDVTDEASFNNIRNWIRNIEQHASDNVNKILVGNKADMDESKRVSASAVCWLFKQQGAPKFEVRCREFAHLRHLADTEFPNIRNEGACLGDH